MSSPKIATTVLIIGILQCWGCLKLLLLLYILNLAEMYTVVHADSLTEESQNGLFPPPLRGLPCSFWCSALVLVTLRHGCNFLLQPPHLLPVLPANLPVWAQGFTATEDKREIPILYIAHLRFRDVLRRQKVSDEYVYLPVSLCEPCNLLSIVPPVWGTVRESCVRWVMD